MVQTIFQTLQTLLKLSREFPFLIVTAAEVDNLSIIIIIISDGKPRGLGKSTREKVEALSK